MHFYKNCIIPAQQRIYCQIRFYYAFIAKNRHIQKSFETFKFFCFNNNKCLLLYLSDKSSGVSLWLGQILVSSRFENAGIGAKLRFTRNFFIMVRVQTKQNIANR